MPERQHFSRAAGIAIPLFALRGAHDSGSGTILDLIPFIDWLGRWHQRVVQLLPLNESGPGEASPYNALSAFAIDPTYISTSQVSDISSSRVAPEWLNAISVRRRLQRLRRSRHRQRQALYALKLHLLELGFQQFEAQVEPERRARFESFCRTQSWWIEDYALFRALKERFDWASWETWPEELRQRDTAALRQAASRLTQRVRFAQYLQWVAAEQWTEVRAHAARRGVLIKGDLPFVCGRDSADVWAHRELFDLSSSAGAPPDAFSPSGQQWGLPLYAWVQMRRSGYGWWRQRARQARELYDLFRVDHLVGVFRTYAIPVTDDGTSGFVPRETEEQLIQGRDLLGALLDEAGGVAGVIAEDLGTVPMWVRESLTQLGIPGYKVFRWETHDGAYIDPRSYPELSVATTGTHDTDTLAVWWEGLSEKERQAALLSLNVVDSGPSTLRLGSGQAQDSGLSTQDSGLPLSPDLHLALLHRLYEAGSVLTILPIQDLFGWSERINTPATINRRNWSYRLPVTIDGLDQTPAIRERMEVLRAMIDQSGRNPVVMRDE
jgi:4-alpha-glucanotransferase